MVNIKSYDLVKYHGVHRNIDKDMAWILPLLADKSAIKAQIFVLRKDTADIVGRKI